MLTGDLVRVRTSHERVIPLYINRDSPQWLEAAESLLMIFREGTGMTRGEIEEEIDELFGEGGKATLVHRGLAKVLEDRAEFEVVADVPPDLIRERVFSAAARYRQQLRTARPAGETRQAQSQGPRPSFRRDAVLAAVASELKTTPETLLRGLFADLRDENRLLKFEDMTAQRLLDRYNVALAQAVLLRSVRVEAEIRNEGPARYRQLFRRLKFHRLVYRVRGSMGEGYSVQIDGPLSLFTATTKYGLQMALFLPALLHCHDFRLDAELRWGPKRQPRSFHLDASTGLITHQLDSGVYIPAEVSAFVERFRQVAPAWELSECTDVLELGREGVWVPDYRAVHKATGTDVFIEVLGFWKKSSLDRLLRLLPRFGPPRFVLVVSERLKVDEGSLSDLPGPILRFKEIPSAPELAALLETFVNNTHSTARLFEPHPEHPQS
jgi:predicted nuclease of restriction endonuclease-like RecB superfamily